MINIRRSLFETNSSSVNSITLLTEKEYDRWKNGNSVLILGSDTVMDKENAIELDSLDYDFRYSVTYYTYDEFLERTEYDISMTTRNGQHFVEIDYTWYDG